MRYIVLIISLLSLVLQAGQVRSKEEKKEADKQARISREDMEIVQMLETLKLMDMLQEYDMIKDMEILIEEDTNEDQK